ncbi:MAG: hypothetical protein CMK72_06230 [Pseudomonadaceae bacterium]|nr:hypothetical protein [Pseudomonadaceae bacterium]
MIPSARKGDSHVCPLPGHGTTAINSASGNVVINGMGSARVGDACGCGAVIIAGFPTIMVNGRPMAYLGSPTSHGGMIISGSENVGGGVIMGPIVDFQKMGAIGPDGSVSEPIMADLISDPNLLAKAVAAGALVDPNAPTPQACTDPDQMIELATYIAGEMNKNIHDPAVLEMHELNSYDPLAKQLEYRELPLYLQLGPTPNFFGIALGKKTRAAAIWMGKVGQDQVWDHKKYLFANFRGAWQKQGEYDYYYDIWSNVHYGYVGVIAGVPEALLLDAAGVEQIGSDTVRWARDGTGESHGPQLSGDLSEGLRAFDDAPDRISVGIGVKLAKQYPKGGVTGEMIKAEVLAVPITDWGAGIQAHECR